MKKLVIGCIFLAMGTGVMKARNEKIDVALFAGGCFWGSQAAFEKIDGVQKVIVGYAGEKTDDKPTYQNYAQRGYVEAFQVDYDPAKVSYKKLLDAFWKTIDPTDDKGQFANRGPQYRSIIFYMNNKQKKEAPKSKKELEKSGRFSKPIVTEIEKAPSFYPAEEYHQGYLKKKSRQHTPKKKYKKASKDELKKKLTPLQYAVTQEKQTEPAFANKYWENTQEGIYVDIVSGEPLFSSQDKYKSGTGWPSFTKPLEKDNIIEKEDRGFFTVRMEVRSKQADSHLGHVFQDGPPPTGLRYCINSAALRFIPVKDLQKKRYGNYLKLFEKEK